MPSANDKVLQYLEEAHGIESMLVSTLTAHIAMTPRSEYRDLLERHRYETRTQAQRIQTRMSELGKTRSLLHVAYGAAQTAVGQSISLALAPIQLLRGTGGEEKLLKNARDECATEALEIATYDALAALAEAVGDERTAVLAREHRTQEEIFLKELRELIPELTRAVVAAELKGDPSYDPTKTGAADAVRKAGQEAKHVSRTVQHETEVVAGQAAAAGRAAASDVAAAATNAVSEAADEVEDAVESAAEAGAGAARRTGRFARDQARKVPGAEEVEGEIRGATAGPDELPIQNYDRLTVEQILPKLRTLSAEELAAIDGFERGGRARKRVLDRIAALRNRRVEEELART